MSIMGFAAGGLPPLVAVVKADIAEFEAKMAAVRAEVDATGQKGGSALSQFGSLAGKALLGIGAAALVGGVASLKMASDFDAAMERVHTQAGASQGEVDDLKNKVLALAPAVGVGPDQLALGLYHLESAGFRGAQAMDLLKNAAEGAKIGNADLEAVTQAMIATVASGIPGVNGAADAMALLNATVGIGDMKMQGLSMALATGILPSARSAGLAFEDVAAALATVTDNATPPDEAATRLRMTFSLLAAPTGKAQKALESIGISSSTLASDMRQPQGLLVALEDLKSHLEASGKSAVAQNEIVAHAFGGGRTSGTILTLLEEIDRLRLKYVQLGTESQRQAQFQDAWASTQKQMNQRLSELAAGAESAAIHVGHDLAPAANTALGVIVDLGHGLGDTISFIKNNETELTALGLVLSVGLAPKIVETTMLFGRMIALNGYLAFMTMKDAIMGVTTAFEGMSVAEAGATLGLSAVLLAGAAIIEMNKNQAAAARQYGAEWVQASQIANTQAAGSFDDYVIKTKADEDQLVSNREQLKRMLDGTIPGGPNLLDGDRFSADTKKMKQAISDLQGQFTSTYQEADAYTSAINAAAQATGASQNQVFQLAGGTKGLGDMLKQNRGNLGDFTTAVVSMALQAKNGVDPQKQLAAAVSNLGNGLTSTAQQAADLGKALRALVDPAYNADNTAINFDKNLADLGKQLDSTSRSIDGSTDAVRTNRLAIEGAIQKADDMIGAAQANGASQQQLAQQVDGAKAAIENQAVSLGLNRDSVKALVDELLQIPPAVSTTVNVDTTAAAASLARLNAQIQTFSSAANTAQAAKNARQGFATGGYADPGSTFMVGEAGREMVTLTPGGGAYIANAGDTGRLAPSGGGGGVIQNTIVLTLDGREIARAVQRHDLRNQARGGTPLGAR